MDITQKHNVFFLGAGGIGMSALARHFKNLGYNVAGYDRTPTPLTQQLAREGIDLHYSDSKEHIPAAFINSHDTLVVYTPAIPKNNQEFLFFQENGFEMVKRAYILGLITNSKTTIAVAGTHGKTSVSTITACLLKNSSVDCSAFLGGISKNFDTNYLYSDRSNLIVAEADEYDRSFLHIHPQIAVITAIDPDHLEIYSNKENIVSSFNTFINQINPNGSLIIHKKITDLVSVPNGIKTYKYSLYDRDCDFFVSKKEINNGLFTFTLHTPEKDIQNITLGIPGNVNLENSVAAIAAATMAGVTHEEIKATLPVIKGVKRRFDIRFHTKNKVYIDDYAHHPEEIRRFLESVREIFPDKKIAGIFQPHLFTRTRDFAREFAQSLSLLDSLYLLEIYPAREEPIPGITSEIILKDVTCRQKQLCTKNEFPDILYNDDSGVLVTIGAGDIDTLTIPIINLLKEFN